MSIAAPEPTSPLPTQEPRSILPIVAQLFTLLQAASAPTPPSLNLTDDAALARNREVDAVAQTLRTQLAEAERYARELPGGDVREEEVEKVIRVLERRIEDGRQLLETLSTLPLPVLSSLTTTTPSAAKNDADVEMDQ